MSLPNIPTRLCPRAPLMRPSHQPSWTRRRFKRTSGRVFFRETSHEFDTGKERQGQWQGKGQPQPQLQQQLQLQRQRQQQPQLHQQRQPQPPTKNEPRITQRATQRNVTPASAQKYPLQPTSSFIWATKWHHQQDLDTTAMRQGCQTARNRRHWHSHQFAPTTDDCSPPAGTSCNTFITKRPPYFGPS